MYTCTCARESEGEREKWQGEIEGEREEGSFGDKRGERGKFGHHAHASVCKRAMERGP